MTRRSAPSRIGHGIMEKGVSSSYERNHRPKEKIFDGWVNQVELQVTGGLAALNESAAANTGSDLLCGDHLTSADINAVMAHDFIATGAPYLLQDNPYPALAALAQRCNEHTAFAETVFKPG